MLRSEASKHCVRRLASRENIIVAARVMIALGATLTLFAMWKQGAIGLTLFQLPVQGLLLLGVSAYGITRLPPETAPQPQVTRSVESARVLHLVVGRDPGRAESAALRSSPATPSPARTLPHSGDRAKRRASASRKYSARAAFR